MADEVRLIDANDYRKRRCRTCINRVQCDNGGNLCFDIMVLNTCPTIEAEPVKHGRWKLRCYGDYPYCSNCNNEPKGREITLFCPNCGSKQDLGGD